MHRQQHKIVYSNTRCALTRDYHVNISVQRLRDDNHFISVKLTCTSDANPPTSNFSWYHNSNILTNNTQHLILSGGIQGGTLSTSSLVIHDIGPSHSGKYECLASTDLGVANASLYYSIIPDPPSWFIVDQNQTTSSTLFVAWQPGFDGGLPQTFTLKYCLNDTQVQDDGCGLVTNLTGESHMLTGLEPFTWYRLTLWAVNSAGNSSPEVAVASTAPSSPESYGITITRDRKKHILTFSNTNESLEDICLIVITDTFGGGTCASKNETECVEPGTEVSIAPQDDPVVVTYGRGLCSKPAKIHSDKEQSSGNNSTFLTVALGVIASAGFILLISVGLMYFHGVLCCAKLKEGNGKNTRPEGQTVDDDGLVYTSVAHDRDHPPNAPPIQTEEATAYASLNSEAMKSRKGELKYSDTKATTPDGQPMYGNYLVKKRKQEQARMPPPVQTDDASHNPTVMGCHKGDMKFGDKGPVTPDGQPMYGNYLVKMRKEEKAKQIAGTPDVFQMYGI